MGELIQKKAASKLAESEGRLRDEMRRAFDPLLEEAGIPPSERAREIDAAYDFLADASAEWMMERRLEKGLISLDDAMKFFASKAERDGEAQAAR